MISNYIKCSSIIKKFNPLYYFGIFFIFTALLYSIFPFNTLSHSGELPSHPLDPLTSSEYKSVLQTLANKNHIDRNSRFPQITLKEPSKQSVLKWKKDDDFQRRAFMIVKDDNKTFEAVVDINNLEVDSWKEIEDVQPGFLLTEEWLLVKQIVMKNELVKKALRKKGIEEIDQVVSIPHTVGYYNTGNEENRRLVKVTFYDKREVKNFWGRPIEGLIAVVDLNSGKIMELKDSDKPLSDYKNQVDFDGKGDKGKNTSFKNPNIHIEGNFIKWYNWKFHFRIDPRLGPVFSLVKHLDKGNYRSILYQGSLSELYVPYMDPAEGWYFKTYMDAGEYGIGKLASGLIENVDCPEGSILKNAEFVNEWGQVYKANKVACIFEIDTGNVAWRHHEAVNQETDSKKATELVVRLISTVGSYDYIFDWIFKKDGTIKVSVGSTGVPQVKEASESNYGNRISENLVGVNHDHYFAFRLDMDIDGTNNSFQIDRLRPETLEETGPRKSIWAVESDIAGNEKNAMLTLNIKKPSKWRIINPSNKNIAGNPVSYQLKPSGNAASLLNQDEYPQIRAGFIKNNLWVTPYDPEEIYAAGTYTNQSKGENGLSKWTENNRSIENKDIVLWYTLGMHHVVRSEDWPVMPTVYSGFELRPFDYFNYNPALD